MASAAEAGAGGEEAGAAGGGKKKLIIIGAGGLVALAAIGGGAWFFLMGGDPPADASAPAEQEVVKPAFYYELPEMVVNLASVSGRSSFIKIQVSLEVPDKAMFAQIEPNMPRVLDAFQVYLRELRVTDLQGSAGMFRMKEELLRRVNLAVYPARVDDVLFRNIIIQ